LCLAIGASWIVVYLAGTGIYLAHLPVKTHFAVSGLSLVLLGLSFGELKKLWQSAQVRRTVFGFLILLFWNWLMLSLIRHYSGGLWSGDWYEHYERSLFFVDYLPRDTIFLDKYALPARPPMMNILCAHVLAQVGEGFDLFQPAAAFFNLLIYFPLVLLSGALARRGRRGLAVLVILLAASPLLAANVTFTWTKLFCGFYVLLGIWLYLRGFQKQDSARLAGGFAMMCAGLLVHYSAGPYALFIGLHYAYVWWRRKRKWIEPVLIAAVCAPLLATWFGWSIWFYGLQTTVGSNTSVSDSEQLTFAGNMQKIGMNILATLVPHPLHLPRHRFETFFYQPNPLGHLRDYWFLIYQQTAPAGMGIAAGLVVIFLAARKLLRGKKPAWKRVDPSSPPPLADSLRIFWGGLVVVCTLVGIASVGTEDGLGQAHICLLPLELLGVAFLAANFGSLPLWLRRTLAVFVVFDFCFGVYLQIRMESLYFHMQTVGSASVLPLNDQLLSRQAVFNSTWRAKMGLAFFGDHFDGFAGVLLVLMIVLGAGLLHALGLAVRGSALPLRRRPDWFFYTLLVLLAVGTLYCSKDEFDGSAAAARQLVSNSDEQMRTNAARFLSDEAAVAAAPGSSEALLELGEARYRSGDVLGGSDDIAEAYALDPFNPRARYDGLVLYDVGTPYRDASGATLNMAENVYLDPQSPEARKKLGTLLLLQDHFDQAVANLGLAVEFSGGSDADSLSRLGIALQSTSGPDHVSQSIDYLSQALHLQPGSADIADALRNSLRMRGDSDDQINSEIEQIRLGG
jgi:tetratricopeptide (TPR) repeat protein